MVLLFKSKTFKWWAVGRTRRACKGFIKTSFSRKGYKMRAWKFKKRVLRVLKLRISVKLTAKISF